MSFSERYGYKPIREKFQLESIDEPLRVTLWNQSIIYYWSQIDDLSTYDFTSSDAKPLYNLCVNLWVDFFKQPINEMENTWRRIIYSQIKYYYEHCEWYEVYDFIEFIGDNYINLTVNNKFIKACNRVLTRELSAYRFVGNQISRITNEEEIESIEKAIEESNDQVGEHLTRALELLSDRKFPDYRNSIKESISAVESLVQRVVGEKGTFGKLLEKIEGHFELHPALKDSFKKLYGYTSDEDGIRHAMLEETKLDFDDAKFMLVTCSAFINYVRGKLEKS